MFTARYELGPYITQILFVFKGLKPPENGTNYGLCKERNEDKFSFSRTTTILCHIKFVSLEINSSFGLHKADKKYIFIHRGQLNVVSRTNPEARQQVPPAIRPDPVSPYMDHNSGTPRNLNLTISKNKCLLHFTRKIRGLQLIFYTCCIMIQFSSLRAADGAQQTRRYTAIISTGNETFLGGAATTTTAVATTTAAATATTAAAATTT